MIQHRAYLAQGQSLISPVDTTIVTAWSAELKQRRRRTRHTQKVEMRAGEPSCACALQTPFFVDTVLSIIAGLVRRTSPSQCEEGNATLDEQVLGSVEQHHYPEARRTEDYHHQP